LTRAARDQSRRSITLRAHLLLAELAAQALDLGSLGGGGAAFGGGLVLQREVPLHLQPQQLVELDPDHVLALRVLPRLVEVAPQQRQRVRCQLQLLPRDRPLILHSGLGLRRLGGQLLVLRPGVRKLVLQPVRVVDVRLHQYAAVVRGGARRGGPAASPQRVQLLVEDLRRTKLDQILLK
jgi:hypothetical protein